MGLFSAPVGEQIIDNINAAKITDRGNDTTLYFDRIDLNSPKDRPLSTRKIEYIMGIARSIENKTMTIAIALTVAVIGRHSGGFVIQPRSEHLPCIYTGSSPPS